MNINYKPPSPQISSGRQHVSVVGSRTIGGAIDVRGPASGLLVCNGRGKRYKYK